jgi:large subunit ribosomal protein L35
LARENRQKQALWARNPLTATAKIPTIPDSSADGDLEKRKTMSAKMKTHKGVKKRIRLSATGKAKHRPCGTSHRNVRVSSKRKRNLRGNSVVEKSMTPAIQRALGKYSN